MQVGFQWSRFVTAQPLPVGSAIVDDAHAALSRVEEQATIFISADHPLYRSLLSKFKNGLQRQGLGQYLAIEGHDPSASPLRVPFWDWANETPHVAQELFQYRNEVFLQFARPFLGDCLAICEAVFTSRSLEIRPPCPPIMLVSSYKGAKRRIVSPQHWRTIAS